MTSLETALKTALGDPLPEPVIQFAAVGEFADMLRARGWDDSALRAQYREGSLIRVTLR